MSSFEFIVHKACYLCSYRRVTGLIITHQRAALFTARRQEMIEVLERSFFYLLTHPEVHSPHSEIPFQVIFRLIELVIVSIALHVLSSLQLFYCVVSSFCSRSSRMLYSFSYLIFQRCLDEDMPQLDFFSLLRESDYQFASRSGWRYRRDSPVYMPVQSVHIMPP